MQPGGREGWSGGEVWGINTVEVNLLIIISVALKRKVPMHLDTGKNVSNRSVYCNLVIFFD